MGFLTHKPTVSNSLLFQNSKVTSIRNTLVLANRTLLTVAVLALTCSALPALAQSENQGAAVNVLEDNPNRIVIRYEFGDFLQQQVVIDRQTYNAIFLKSESNKKKVGAPALPDVSRSIIIPDDARMAVRVLDSSYYEIENIDIAPSKGYISRKINPADVPYTFGKAYETDAFYPGPLAVLREPYIMRDQRGIVVTANPFQYNPVGRVLRVYTDMTIEVVAIGLGKLNVLHRKPRKLSRAFHQLYSSHFINYDLDERYAPLDEQGEMLIIVHDAWNANVQPLKTHKVSIGINTSIKNVSTIPGGNNSTSIKNYIQSVYDSNDLAFVLLVGDYLEVVTPTASGGASDPTYSKLAGADDYPDIMVGRFSAESASDVNTQVERTIEYENLGATQRDWFWKGTGIASEDGTGNGDDSEWDWEHIRNIRTDLLNYGYTEVDELYEGSQGGGDAAGSPTYGMVSTSVNAGRGIINYCGHGSTTAWVTTGFNNADVDALTNNNMLPFIFDVACLNGDFNGNTCFAEAWMRATNGGEPTGAIGIYASSILQSWNPPMEGQDEFNSLYVTETYNSYGTYCYAGACSMMDDYPPGDPDGSGVDMFNTWHIFGDPSLVSVEGPNTPPVAYDDSVSTYIDTPVNITLIATDEGQPDPPGALTYIIASLPSDGNLSDPCAGLIGSVPYTLAGGGNVVTYTPDSGYVGPDEFNFKANDGGTDPNGGDSNIATITIDVQLLPVVIYEIDFESGPGGWTINNNFGDANGLWHLTVLCESTLPDQNHTAPTSLYYGLDISCDYDANQTEGVVTSPTISLAEVNAPIELSFKYFLGTEGLAPSYDVATVEISENGGLFNTVASNSDHSLTDPSGGWLPAVIDISSMAGSDIKVRFTFRTVDPFFNAYPGFYVDDINVAGIVVEHNCAPPPEPNNPDPPDEANDVPVDTLLQWNLPDRVVINEISIGSTDWLELYNPTNSAVELTGWQVSAIRTDMTTVLTIPTFTLAANAYVVLHETSGTNTSTDIYFDQNIYWHNYESGSCALTDGDGTGIDFARWTDQTGSLTSSEPPPVGTNWTGNDPAAPADEDLHTLGRCGLSSDTDDGSDWENTSGVDASTPTPGGSNTGRRSSPVGFENTPEIDLDRGEPVRSIRTVKPAAIEKASVRDVSADGLADINDDEPIPLPLPRYATPEEQKILQERRLLRALEPRKVAPRVAPSGMVWTPGDYEPLDGVLLAWEPFFQSLLTEFIVGLSDPNSDSTAYVVVDSNTEQTNVYNTLAAANADMNNVEFLVYTTDSVWIRDYGPRYFYHDGDLTIMDHNYNRPRPLDDAFPSWLGTYWSETVYELDDLNLEHGGGNFLVVSDGNAFVCSGILDENPGYSKNDIVQIFADYHNVNVTIYSSLPPSVDPTGHIDMWLMPLSDNDILVSKFSDGAPGDPCTEVAVADLEARGYTVWRTPAWVSDSTHYTYTNAAIVNNRVFIPKYNDSNDAIALSVFQQAMPDHEIIQVDCSSIIPYAGAVHCIMEHIFTATPPVTWDVYLDTDDERPLMPICSDLSEPICEPGPLNCDTTYYWQVIARNCCGTTPGKVWSFTTQKLTGDITKNCRVDWFDLKILADEWLNSCTAPEWCAGADIDESTSVDFKDFAMIALNWLDYIEP